MSPIPMVWGTLMFLMGQCVVGSAAISTIPLIPHHVQVRRRLGGSTGVSRPTGVRRREEAKQVGALYHGHGTHYMDLWCGTPPQRQTVIVETASGWTGFPCSGCHSCGAPLYHIDNYFKEEESSTFSKIPCGQCSASNVCVDDCSVTMSYAEGSTWEAFEAKDKCYVGGPHNLALPDDLPSHTEDIDPDHASHFAFDLVFGCQNSVTGLFEKQLADGIMGMGNSPYSFWQQMFRSGEMGTLSQFSLCFARPPEESRKGTEAGAMTLGGVDPRLHDSEMVYIDMEAGSRVFIEARVRAIYLRHGDGGESAKSSNSEATIINLNIDSMTDKTVLVDSGTTDTYWNKRISAAFTSAFQLLSGISYHNNAMWLTAAQVNALPTILLQFEGDPAKNAEAAGEPDAVGLAGDVDPDHPHDVIWAIPPSHYLELDEHGRYVPRFYMTESSRSTLGANAMMGHDVMFDLTNRRFGLAESDCDYHKLVTEGGYTDVLEETEIGTNEGDAQDTSEDEASTDDDVDDGMDSDVDSDVDDGVDGDVDGEGSGSDSDDGESEETGSGSIDDSMDTEGEDSNVEPLDVDKAEEKKEHPHDDSTHASQTPMDDAKKSATGSTGFCSSATCRAGTMATVAILVAASLYVKRQFNSEEHRQQLVPTNELELTSNDFSTSYRDKGAYLDASIGEYSEFEATGTLS